MRASRPGALRGSQCRGVEVARSLLQIEDDGDGAVVDQGDLHAGAEDPGLHPGAEIAQRLHHGGDQRFGHRPRRGCGPGRATALSQVAGLAVPAPSPRFGAPGAEVVAALAGHAPAVATQFALTEGLPAAGIAVISVALARTARQRGAAGAGSLPGRVALVSGLVAAIISALQFGLGIALTATAAPGPAHLLYASVDRLDGAKMLALAVLGGSAAAMTALPRWLRYTGIALAVTITCSGLVYLLLAASLTAAAVPALVLLLAFMTGCGIMIGMKADQRDR